MTTAGELLAEFKELKKQHKRLTRIVGIQTELIMSLQNSVLVLFERLNAKKGTV